MWSMWPVVYPAFSQWPALVQFNTRLLLEGDEKHDIQKFKLSNIPSKNYPSNECKLTLIFSLMLMLSPLNIPCLLYHGKPWVLFPTLYIAPYLSPSWCSLWFFNCCYWTLIFPGLNVWPDLPFPSFYSAIVFPLRLSMSNLRPEIMPKSVDTINVPKLNLAFDFVLMYLPHR